MASLRESLDDIPLFAGMHREDIDALFELASVRNLKAEQTLFKEGELSDALWIVLSGDVEISREGTTLAEVSRGAALGEVSLFADTARRSATVTAICPVTVLRLPVSVLRKRLKADDPVVLKLVARIAHQLALRLVALNERLLSDGRKGMMVARSELRRVLL